MIKRLLLVTLLLFAGVLSAETEDNYTPIEYACGGGVTTFTFSWAIGQTSDIEVILKINATEVEEVLIETTHYDVSATNNDYSSGGTVTTVATYANTYTLTIRRDTAKTQTSNLEDTRKLDISDVMEGFDKLTRADQDIHEILDRCIKNPKTDTTDATLPNLVLRAGTWLYVGDDGTITVSDGLAPDDVIVSAFMETVLDDDDADEALATLEILPLIEALVDDAFENVEDAFENTALETMAILNGIPVFNVMNPLYGAMGDGVTPENVAIAAAATAATGKTLLFPPGTYLIDADITIGSTVQLLFLRGAQLSIDAGKTFTIGGQIDAGYYEIFTGDGSVSFTTEIDNWKPEWFGTTLGIRNTISGFQAGEDLTSGTADTVYGHRAAANMTTAAKITAFGTFALEDIITNTNCSAFGYLAARENTADNITAVGSNALTKSVGAKDCTAVGTNALGSQNNVLAISNTAVGFLAGLGNISGSNLTIVGVRAMRGNTTALNGVAIGVEAGHGNIHAEQILDGDFSETNLPTGWTLGAGWSVDNGNNEVDKDGDGTGTLTATLVDAGDAYIDYGVGVTYQIAYTILNHTVGDVTVTFGGETDTTRSGDGDFTWDVTPSVYNDAARALTFTPTNTSRFSVTDVSFTLSTVASHSGLTAVGVGAGYMVTEGNNNTWIGIGAGRQNGGGANMTGVGSECFRQGGGSGGVGLGKQAGYYETGSNKLFIDNTSRASESDGRLKALIYGVFAADPDDQLVRVNGMFESYAVSTRTVEVSSAEMLDLAASPKELVAAPGADHLLEFVSATLIYDSAATDYTVQADENIAIRYENGTGTIVSLTVESDSLIKEAAGDGIRIVHPIATFQDTDVVGAVNKSLVLDNIGSGEWDDGTGTLTVKITWRIHELGL